jgi:hypothetical protein
MSAIANNGVQRPSLSDPAFSSAPQKDATLVFKGALVMLDTVGRAQPAAASVGGAYCVGVAIARDFDLDRYDNQSSVVGHADGFLTVRYQEGCFGFLNDGGAPIVSTTQPGTPVFAVDDQTVSLSSNAGLRPFAGRLRGLDATVIGGPVVVEVSRVIGSQLYQGNMGMENIGAVLAIAGNLIAPVYGIHHVGAGLIKNITVPSALQNVGGTITLIPDAAFTTDATGNIALASTAVVSRVMTMTWDPVAAKWFPSY